MSGAAVFAAGIFAHESGQRLLQILLKLGDRGFGGLYEKCTSNINGSYYQAGLKRVSAWSDSVLLEDIEYVKASCPDMEETCDACFVQYVLDRFRQKRSTHRCPPLIDFVRNFLESLGQHESLITGEYFSKRDPVVTRVACMDAARQAFYSLVTSENVRVELASEVGSVARSVAPSFASRVEKQKDNINLEIRPDDSISQVGSVQVQDEVPASSREKRRAPSPEPESSPPPKAKARPRAPESVTSRHDFNPIDEDASQDEMVVVKPSHVEPPPRKERSDRQFASSRDSHVSIGCKQVKSPRH